MQKPLEERSTTELRSIAQGCGVEFTFATDKTHLIQAIRLKTAAIAEPQTLPMPVIDRTERIRTVPPARNLQYDDIEQHLKPFVDRGIRLTFPTPETWRMDIGKRTDSGNIRVPLRVIVSCAERLLA